MKTLQEQYNLIQEGKGHKDVFMKSARRLFPEYITNFATFQEATKILKQKSILSEAVGGIVTQTSANPFVNWDKFLNEEAKAEEKKTTKEVEEMETKGYDYKDPKNTNNLNFEEMLRGYYAEMKDPKNADKTEEQLREMVAKNLAKDPSFYVKDGAFGIKGIGYTDDVPGLKVSNKELKGEYASSGMEKVKMNESKNSSVKKKKAKKESTESKLAEIEKQGRIVTMEAQIEALDELINSKTQRLSMISEDEDLSEIADKNKIKEMQREVKELQKRKMKMEKLYEKMCGKSYSKPEIVDEEKAEKGNSVDESVVKENLKDLSKMSIEQLNQLYQDLEDEMYNELSMDASGDASYTIVDLFQPKLDQIEAEINSRSGALSSVRADDFPLDKDDTDPAGGSGLASYI